MFIILYIRCKAFIPQGTINIDNVQRSYYKFLNKNKAPIIIWFLDNSMNFVFISLLIIISVIMIKYILCNMEQNYLSSIIKHEHDFKHNESIIKNQVVDIKSAFKNYQLFLLQCLKSSTLDKPMLLYIINQYIKITNILNIPDKTLCTYDVFFVLNIDKNHIKDMMDYINKDNDTNIVDSIIPAVDKCLIVVLQSNNFNLNIAADKYNEYSIYCNELANKLASQQKNKSSDNQLQKGESYKKTWLTCVTFEKYYYKIITCCVIVLIASLISYYWYTGFYMEFRQNIQKHILQDIQTLLTKLTPQEIRQYSSTITSAIDTLPVASLSYLNNKTLISLDVINHVLYSIIIIFIIYVVLVMLFPVSIKATIHNQLDNLQTQNQDTEIKARYITQTLLNLILFLIFGIQTQEIDLGDEQIQRCVDVLDNKYNKPHITKLIIIVILIFCLLFIMSIDLIFKIQFINQQITQKTVVIFKIFKNILNSIIDNYNNLNTIIDYNYYYKEVENNQKLNYQTLQNQHQIGYYNWILLYNVVMVMICVMISYSYTNKIIPYCFILLRKIDSIITQSNASGLSTKELEVINLAFAVVKKVLYLLNIFIFVFIAIYIQSIIKLLISIQSKIRCQQAKASIDNILQSITPVIELYDKKKNKKSYDTEYDLSNNNLPVFQFQNFGVCYQHTDNDKTACSNCLYSGYNGTISNQFYELLGVSGSGKTTLTQVLMGNVSHYGQVYNYNIKYSGSIDQQALLMQSKPENTNNATVLYHNVQHIPTIHERVLYLYQSSDLIDHTLKTNICGSLPLDNRILQYVMKQLNLKELNLRNIYYKTSISGSTLQLIKIANLVYKMMWKLKHNDPYYLVVIDEPFPLLNTKQRTIVKKMLVQVSQRAQKKYNTAVLYIDHLGILSKYIKSTNPTKLNTILFDPKNQTIIQNNNNNKRKK